MDYRSIMAVIATLLNIFSPAISVVVAVVLAIGGIVFLIRRLTNA